MGIHPTAVVSTGAELGEEVEIGPYCVIGPRVRIGAGTRLQSHVVVQGDSWLGSECDVFPFAVLGTTPQDKKVKGKDPEGRLRIGNHNRIRENATIHGGTSFGGGTTKLGDHNMLLAGCHIGHDAAIGNHVLFTNGAMAAGHTVIEDRAILGAMVGVHQFTRVGALAMIGAGAMLSQDAPPFSLVQGDRARLVGVNLVGLHRNAFTADQTATIKRVYRLLFWRHGTMTEKVEFIRRSALCKDDLCLQLLDFVAASRRGVCMPRPGTRALERARKEIPDAESA